MHWDQLFFEQIEFFLIFTFFQNIKEDKTVSCSILACQKDEFFQMKNRKKSSF